MLVLIIVAACFLAASALTVAAVILSSRLNQDSYDAAWLPEEQPPTAVPAAPDADLPAA